MKKIKFNVNGKTVYYDIKKDHFDFLNQEMSSTDLEILMFQVNFQKARESLDVELILNKVVERFFDTYGTETTIYLLSDLGVTQEQLIHYFGFSIEEVGKCLT